MDNQGIKGIYPDFLQLGCEQESRSKASFLDVLVFLHNDVWYTNVFDKREHKPLSSICQKKYPHPSCFLLDRSKFGIITSRLFCFGQISQRKEDFIHITNMFLMELRARGYTKSRMYVFVKKFLRRFPLNFFVRRRGRFIKALFNNVYTFCFRNNFCQSKDGLTAYFEPLRA